MRILIFILALMSAFFVSAQDERAKVPATSEVKPTWLCTVDSIGFSQRVPADDFSLCESTVQSAFDEGKIPAPTGDYEPYLAVGSSSCSITDISFDTKWLICNQQYESRSPTKPDIRRYELSSIGTLSNPLDSPTYVCQNPEYPDGPHSEPDGQWCYEPEPEEPKDCPAGYHSRAVSLQLGSTECVPKQCPPAGSGENLSSTPLTGGVPFDGGGMYCNDGCAFTVNASQISSSKYAVGTSQGAACGDKPYDNKKLADEGDTGNCTTATNGDVTLLSCPDANPTTPEPDPHNNDESKVNEDDTPEKPKETCAEGDTSCNLKNVETEIENSINRQIDNDNELHNKKIDADTKNAKAFLNAMESIDTAILLQTSQDERLHAVTVGKFNELIDAVNGIETGGGGGGGNGTGNGNIGGQDCEGTIEECAGIGSGDGVELPHETKNLEQYAQKYQNWLPDAELPQEKCVSLTTGNSLCLSFQSFILFFQAISGLIVLSSLIHSASIIVRSV